MIYVLLLCFLYVETSAYSFEEEPDDTNAIEGTGVTLRCIVSDLGTMNVHWYNHAKHRYLSKDREVYRYPDDNGRFSISGDERRGEFFLGISNVTFEDAGMYACLLFESGSFRLSSRNALLQVYQKPEKGFPVCSIIPDLYGGEVGPGDWITLQCVAELEGGSPFSRLDWVRQFEILPGAYLDESQPQALYEFRLTEFHNGAIFTCIENNPALEMQRSCSVMPYYYPTNVTLEVKPKHPKTGDDITIHCIVQAMPSMGLNYTWFLNDTEISRLTANGEYSFNDDGTQLTMYSVNSNYDHSHIECHVINIIELEGKSSYLFEIEDDRAVVKLSPVDTATNPVTLAVVLAIVVTLFLLFIIVSLVILYKRRRVGILHLLKARRSSLRQSQQYTDTQRYTRRPESDDIPADDESAHSVLICTTPHDAIQEHFKELQRTNSKVSERPDKTNIPNRRSSSTRGRSRPIISGPISPVIPDLPVTLRDLNIKHTDSTSIDEDYVSDADTDWDL